MAIEQARLLVLKAAWLIDNVGTKGARTEIAAIKVAAPTSRRATSSTGRSRCTAGPASRPTPRWPSPGRTCAPCTWPTGPDEVHLRSIAREELRAYR